VNNIQEHRDHIKRTGLWNQKMVDRYAKQVKEIILHRQEDAFWNKQKCNILDKELSLDHQKRKSPQELAEALYIND
jgi:putative protein kinase ArgK-like GTPase of G3E family